MTAAIAITSPQTLEEQITELAAHISAATWRLLQLIREYDLTSGWNCGGARSCAHWLNWKCGIDLGAAREKVRVAHALATLPQISAAFREGRLSYSKVRAMTRVATAENEDYLLMIAEHGTASHVERVVRGYRRLGRQEALERERLMQSERSLNWYVDDDGCYVVRAKLPPGQGAHVVRALEAAADALFHERGEGDVPPDEKPSPANHRADALERMAEGYLAANDSQSSGGDRYTLHVHTDITTLNSTLKKNGAGAEAELEDGGHVSAETSRRLACDCGVVHWREDSEGNALDVGRRSRTIGPALRRALQRRDGGCRFPGCTARHHVDAHHIRHWADGGETKLDNLVLLCRHHHRRVHEDGFGVEVAVENGTDRKVVFTHPNGQPLAPGPDTRFRGNVSALAATHLRMALNIDAKTGLSRWLGEKMDLGMALEGLRRRDCPD